MVTTILFAAITALVMCFLASLVEDFILPHRARKPEKHLNPARVVSNSTSEKSDATQ